MSRTPTVEDVAAAAGVSTATVSRCLNSPEKVVEKTRRRVLEAVERLGYAPNFSARALVAKRTQTIGAVIPTIEDSIFAEAIHAFQTVLQQERFTLLIATTDYNPDQEAEAIRTLAARGADGLLLVGFDRAPSVYEFLNTQSIPAVAAWVYDPNGPIPSVGFENAMAMEKLTRHAIELGHETIGVISAAQVGNDRARGRVSGIQTALANAHCPPATVIETTYGITEGAAALNALLAVAPDITLVICGNDVLAAGAMAEARRRGLRIPDDLSITGFDDMELAQLVQPALTSVQVPHRAMGEAAARALLKSVNGEACESLLLETELKLRDSLVAPRRN